jgi:hypothetical protein
MGRPRTGTPPARAAVTIRNELRELILNMQGSPEYFDFVDSLQRKTGITKSQMFRMAFADWCKASGHGNPPEI